MQRLERDVGGVQPITVQAVRHMGVLGAGDRATVEEVPGLSGGVAGHVLDQAVALAVGCKNWGKEITVSKTNKCMGIMVS